MAEKDRTFEEVLSEIETMVRNMGEDLKVARRNKSALCRLRKATSDFGSRVGKEFRRVSVAYEKTMPSRKKA